MMDFVFWRLFVLVCWLISLGPVSFSVPTAPENSRKAAPRQVFAKAPKVKPLGEMRKCSLSLSLFMKMFQVGNSSTPSKAWFTGYFLFHIITRIKIKNNIIFKVENTLCQYVRNVRRAWPGRVKAKVGPPRSATARGVGRSTTPLKTSVDPRGVKVASMKNAGDLQDAFLVMLKKMPTIPRG